MKTTVVLLGAGRGIRMAGRCKSFIKIKGVTLLERAIACFTPYADEMIVGVCDKDLERAKRIVGNNNICIMAGGQSRLDTLKTLVEKAHYQSILVHDIARPFIHKELIDKLFDASACHPAVALCTPFRSSDALVIAKQNKVGEMVHGSFLFRVQTPIISTRDKLRKAIGYADPGNTQYSSIVGILFKSGCSVHLVEGSEDNIKITCREDLVKAERIGCRFPTGSRDTR